MTAYADFFLLLVVMIDLYIVSASRLAACVKATALQGVALALLPVAMWWQGSSADLMHVALMSGGALAFKAIAIPLLLLRAIRDADVRREVEPFVSLHLSVLVAAVLVGISFWLASALPHRTAATLLTPVAFATLLVGLFVLVSRRRAVTQVVGYVMIENGVFIFGQSVAAELPFVVELGVLLDLLVGVFVMGIAIYDINREFDHINVDELDTLRG